MSAPPGLLSKPQLRSMALARRDALTEDFRTLKAASLAAAGGSALLFSGSVVSFYHAIGSEIDPAPLVGVLVEQGVSTSLPVLLDRDTMVFRRWDRSRDLVPAGFGTLGPDSDLPEVLPDLVFAPMAAFTSAGQRVGYGKGHYDRALSKMHGHGRYPAVVGLAFDEQEYLPFPAEEHDVPLDGVLTPSGLRVFQHGSGALAPFLR